MRRFSAGSQKHHNVWMSKCFHGMALTDEIPHGTFIFLFDFENFNSDSSFSPGSFVNDAISALRDLLAQLNLVKGDFHGCIEGSGVDYFVKLEFALPVSLYFDVLLVFVAE